MKRHTEEFKHNAILLYNKYKSYSKVSKELNVSDESVRYWCNSKLKEKRLNYYKDNIHKRRAYNKEYYNKNKKSENKRSNLYLKTHRTSVNKRRTVYHKHKYNTDINYKLRFTLRNRIRDVLFTQGKVKNKRTEELLGCTIENFKKHIENMFLRGMCWKNYGTGGWVLDHIQPCSSFNLKFNSQQKKCFHYTNIQPLWEIDNLKKGAKIERPIS